MSAAPPMNGLLRAEDVTSAQAWNAPQVDGVATGRRPRTVRELQAAEEAVWQGVRDEARAQGLAAAKQEIDARIAQLEARRSGCNTCSTCRPGRWRAWTRTSSSSSRSSP